MPTPVKVAANYLTLSEYRRWVETAKRGDSVVYAVGYLPNLRKGIRDVDRVADLTWEEHWVTRNIGFLHLTQKRLGDFNYEYRATKVGRAPAPAAHSMPLPLPLAA